MTSPRDHERYRRQLEKHLREDVELLYAGYAAKYRAYLMLHQLPGDAGASGDPSDPSDPGRDLLPAAAPPLSLPPAENSFSAPPAETSLRLPPAAPTPPAPPARRSRAYALYYAISDAMEKLPDLFDRHDVEAALGFAPRRASLYRVLEDMAGEGSIALVSRGEGVRTNRYRKLPAVQPQAAGGPD